MDFFERFLIFEKEHKLFSREYSGERYWHLMRFAVLLRIDAAMNPEMRAMFEFANARKASAERLKLLRRFSVLAIKGFFRPRPQSADILVTDQNSYKDIDGVYTDIFIDPLTNHFNAQPMYLSGDFIHPLGRSHPDCSRGMLRYYFILALNKLFGMHEDKKEEEFLYALDEEIHKEFGVKVRSLTELACQNAILCKSFSPYAGRLLDIVKPKAVILVCHYSRTLFIITREAKRRGIPVIELQHGVTTGIAYNFKDTIESKIYFPDYILAYGEYWANNMKLPQGSKAISVGFPHIDSRIAKYADIKRESKLIVFYSNVNNALINVLTEFVGLAKQWGYRVACKMHPCETDKWRCYYPGIENIGIEIIDYSLDIYMLIMSGMHHVGATSTVMYEAIRAGGHVHVHISARPFLDDMVEHGAATEFIGADDLLDHILEKDHNNLIPPNELIAEQLFKSDALNNQVKTIRKIIS